MEPNAEYRAPLDEATKATYLPYVDYVLAGGVAESAYILTHGGRLLATNIPNAKTLYEYMLKLPDPKNPNAEHEILYHEAVPLVELVKTGKVNLENGGIRLCNEKYMVVRGEPGDDHFYLKKNGGGACISKTKNFIIIGTFNSAYKNQSGVAMNPGDLNKRVEALAKDLISKGS